ncbi:MAG: nucleoside triphosphate hydrolase [Paracoccaceae bacterium]|nr:nucleoside triphosphate hydrolase [Paracoccaceae bacterium]
MAPDLELPEGTEELLDRLSALPVGKRSLVAIAGAPGSGKSTIADALAVRLNQRDANRAAVLPMDGYHFDDKILVAMGRLSRKGAPDTFDVGGLVQMLRRLKANTEDAVAVPVFDRELEISRGAARLIPQTTDIIIVEGNYLLSRERPWSALGSSFDLSVFLCVPEAMLRARLVERWLSHGHTECEAAERAERNDLPNGRYVREKSADADVILNVAESAD